VLHPSSLLIVWLFGVLSTQFLGYFGLGLLTLFLFFNGRVVWPRWWAYLIRARWLLLTLWLILAYNIPGEAVFDIALAPTYEGISEANVHAMRLIVMLGGLAWLFVRLGRDGLVGALWGVLQPLAYFGVNSERLVLRLSLVLQNLESSSAPGNWRAMLYGATGFSGAQERVQVVVSVWQFADTVLVGLAGVFFVGALVL